MMAEVWFLHRTYGQNLAKKVSEKKKMKSQSVAEKSENLAESRLSRLKNSSHTWV